jgi:transposase-like protein/DNA-directed RNA polymerase subunit RPC12/RpoP
MRYTFKDFMAEYPDDHTCLDRILVTRYGGHEFICAGCGCEAKFHRITNRRAYACQECGHHVYPCVGTPFEKSRTSLHLWFMAMYWMTSTRHGVAAKELERQLGVTYKTAWRMAHELRKLMANADDHGPMSGHVEVDETYIGGRVRGEAGSDLKFANKTVVFGMLQRDGIVRAGPVPNKFGSTLQPIIMRNVQRGSIVSSDTHGAYKDLSKAGYRHDTVNHGAGQYRKGIHHTNAIEGYWAQLKRGIQGCHIHVSRKHLWKYVSEFSYRYNMRKEPSQMFSGLVSALSLPHLKES